MSGKKIWVIEKGSYSDYCVVGVYSTKENAEIALSRMDDNSFDAPEINEWTLDPHISEICAGRKPYSIEMSPDGNILRVDVCRVEYFDGELYLTSDKKMIRGDVWATDEKHAIKIMNEKRIQMIASGELK